MMEPCSFSTCVVLMPFNCAVKTTSCVCPPCCFTLGLSFGKSNNHAAKVWTASVKNATGVRGCLLTPWRVLHEMEKHNAAVQECL